jgi:ABC-2 type transport system permease protein
VNASGLDSMGAAGRGPGTLRVVLLIARLSLLRLVNRLSHWRSRGQSSKKRGAVARKPRGGTLLLGVLGVTFLFQSVTASTGLVRRTALSAEERAEPDKALVSASTLQIVRWADALARQEAASRADGHRESLRDAFENECAGVRDEDERENCVESLVRAFERRGIAGFRASRIEPSYWPNSDLWYHAGEPFAMVGPLALVGFLLSFAVALQHVAGSDRDLARVDSGLEWLFSFPVRARSVFLARVLEGAFIGPLIWVLVFPFYAVVFCCAGYGWLGVPLGVAAAFYLGTLSGALRVTLETTLRRTLSVRSVSRVQAILLAVSYVVMVVSLAGVYSQRVHWLAGALRWLPRFALYLNPLLVPLWICQRGIVALGAALAALVVALGCSAIAVQVAEWTTRDGLGFGGESARRARRGPSAPRAPVDPVSALAPTGAEASGWFSGMVRKEIYSLLRDRRLRTQALITPVLMVGLQWWLNPQLVSGIASNPRHAATVAFATAMFVLSGGGCSALAMEGPALWMLYTVPQRLERLLLQKLGVWFALSTSFAGAVLAVIGSKWPALLLPLVPHFALALLGIAIYSVVALGVGALGSDPLEQEPSRRIRVGSVYLFMTLASLFGYALYAPSLWAKLVQVVLSSLLAFALWQKVKDHLPFLLDPTEAPPARIAVADGIMAALGFFVLQGLIALLGQDSRLAPAQLLLTAFVVAGLAVAAVTLLVFYRNGVPDLLRAVGLRRPRGYGGRASVDAVVRGVGMGLVAAGFSLGYVYTLAHAKLFSGLRESISVGTVEPGSALWLLLLAVLAAPLFEEFIFRGVLFRGLRRSLGAPSAALASAAVFALVHPMVAALPVFVLALLAAVAYERSRWLLTPILAHMTYNAIVITSTSHILR